MEGAPNERDGTQEEPSSAGESTESFAATRIRRGLETAEAEERVIDDATAREIAQALSSEASPALSGLAVCGVILEDDVYQELYADLDTQTPAQARLVDALRDYCLRRAGKGPVSHWRSPEDRETASGLRPQIWVGSLAAYNVGVLHGTWLDAYQDEEDLRSIVGASCGVRRYRVTKSTPSSITRTSATCRSASTSPWRRSAG